MFRRSSISTLFPYTTLFRSALFEAEHRAHDHAERDVLRVRMEGERVADLPAIECVVGRAQHRQGRSATQDRKSTRLNSSHLGISYAVFCLKKKKKKSNTSKR